MGLTNIERPNPKTAKESKGIHYVVFRENHDKPGTVNEWEAVRKFWATDSPATIADDILTAIKYAEKELGDSIRVAYERMAAANKKK